MKLTALHDVQLRGHIYRRGESCDYDGPVDSRIAANFSAADGSPLAQAPAPPQAAVQGAPSAQSVPDAIAKTVAVLKRDGICRQLDELGVTYPAKSNTEKLARLLLTTKGEIEP